jgi:hypothetical protein
MNVSHLFARHHSLPSILKQKEREVKGEEEKGKKEGKSEKVSTLSAILPPHIIAIRYLHVIIRLLPIIVSEVRIVCESASALVASHTIHEVDAILRVTHDTFLGVAAHHECLVEVRQNVVPACGGAIECKLRWVWVLPFLFVSVCTR